MTLSLRTVGLSALGLAIVAGLVSTAFGDDPVAVDMARLTRGDLSVTVNAEGKTRIRDIYEVSAPISGTVQRLPVAVGDVVVAGETMVAQVEPATAPLLDARSRAQAEAALHEAEASVEYAKAEQARTQAAETYAQAQMDRAEALAKSGTASLTHLEDAAQRLALAQAVHASAKARLSMSEAAVERAKAALAEPELHRGNGKCCLPILSPADGVVVAINGSSERPVQAGAPLLSVGDPRDLELVVDLLSSEATRLVAGAPASVERWGGAALDAELKLIEPAARTVVSALGIEEQRVDAVLDFVSDPQDWTGLGEAFAVYVRIEEWHSKDVLLIPLSAVFQRDGQWLTYVNDAGKARETAIDLGRRDGRHAEVLSGIEAGAEVIMHPPDSVLEGTLITLRVQS
ncbi:MAG: efflux RND transporter periplasmic adaptor subunit [Pelagimonas sp.]|uniref:efflux RND transporter periplasmic adaptor subunit n=1 Tax=Pelagimonas sp. TaxID=2073170 RepID=UPI003D6A75D9